MTVYLPIQAIESIESIGTRALLGLDSAAFCASTARVAQAALAARLRRVLTDRPGVEAFTVHRIIAALQTDVCPSALVMFSAAGIFQLPDAASLSGRMIAALGAGLALGRRKVRLPRRLLRRKIPRNTLSILIQAIGTVTDKAGGNLRERWSWVFHPACSVALGVMLFLLGIVSMAPVIGGGIQHAASAFLIGIGLAERDGLAVMIGAVAGIASIALAMFSVITGARLWSRVKAWLVRCVYRLRLNVLARLLDGMCDGLGDLARIRWGGLLLLMITPGLPDAARLQRAAAPGGRLKQRAQLALSGAGRTGYAC